MQDSTITKIEQAIIILQEAKEEVPGSERFYNDYNASLTLYDLILQLEKYIQKAKDTNNGLTTLDVLRRNLETK
jgi:hypothetical protein